MKKTLTLITTLLMVFLLHGFSPEILSSVKAQEETAPEETNVPTSEPSETTEKLRERIEKIVEQKKDQVKGVIDDLNRQKTGFIGQVERVSEETIALETNRGTVILPLDEGVTLLKGDSDISPESIEVDNWVLVLGSLEDDSFVPKQMTFSSSSLRPNTPIAHLGSLKEIGARKIDFQPRGKNETMGFTISARVSYQDLEGETANKADFSEDDQVLLVGYFDEDDDENVVTVIRALAPFQKDLE